MPSATANGWREQWAQQENARRLVQYNESVERWENDLALVQWYRDLATRAEPQPRSASKELKLRKGEEVFWECAAAQMMEMPDTFSLFAPVHSVYSPLRDSGGYLNLRHQPGSARDTGSVVVTSQRVFFDGVKSNREWTLSQLTGIAHGQSVPMSIMRVSNRQRLSGVLLDGPDAAPFQFYLGLALALHQQDRAGFIAHLAQLEAQHHRSRPPVPLPASPQDAPSRQSAGLRYLFFGGPGASMWRQVTPSLVTAAVVMCACLGLISPPETTPSTSTAGNQGVVAATSSAPPATSRVEVAPPPTSAPAVVAPAPTTAAPKPKSTTKPPSESTCGAPANPWSYDFCSGGSTIPNPPADFCNYFNCIDSFWKNTNGYVIECKDGMFSHSGGRQGSCSYHGGNNRTLTT